MGGRQRGKMITWTETGALSEEWKRAVKGRGAYRPSHKPIFISLLRGSDKGLYEEYAYVIDIILDDTTEPKVQLVWRALSASFRGFDPA